MWKKRKGKVSKLHSGFTNKFYQSAQEKKYSESTGSESQDEHQIKKRKIGDYSTTIAKNIAWHKINKNFSLSDQTILFLSKLGDGIIKPPNKNYNDRFKKFKICMKSHQRNFNWAIKKRK